MAGISSKAAGKMNNRYKFNGIEEGNNFELNYLEAFYRYMDVQTGRFIQIDPVTTHYESPYVMMGNNPIVNMDWLGNYFTFGASGRSEKERGLYNGMRKSNSDQLIGYVKQMDALLQLHGSDNADVQNAIAGLQKMIDKCTELNAMWNEMSDSDVEFNITEDQTINSAGVTSYSSGRNRIDIKLKDFSVKSLGHETRHGFGFLTGEEVATTFGKSPLHDMMDEVAGYNIEIFMSGFEGVDKNVVNGHYTLDYLKSSGRPLADPAYDPIRTRERQLTLNSPATDLLAVTQDGFIINYLRTNSGNTNLTVRDVLNAANQHEINQGRRAVYIFGDALKNR